MKNGDIDKISLEQLKSSDFLNNIKDPLNKGSDCTGLVESKADSKTIDDELDSKSFWVKLCCGDYKMMYMYPSGNTKKISNCKSSGSSCVINLSSEDPHADSIVASINKDDYEEYGLSSSSANDAKTSGLVM